MNTESTGTASSLFQLRHGARLVLASGSPRRKDFLADWGVPFTTRPAPAEPSPEQGEDADDYVLRAARAKLLSAGWEEGELVVAADTVVVRKGVILGKPGNDEESFSMVRSLCGITHSVSTGVAIAYPDGTGESFVDSCEVTFHDWPDTLIRAYVATGEGRDKAGGYAIQGKGSFLVSRIHGSWSTVVGLPVTHLVARLSARGWLMPKK